MFNLRAILARKCFVFVVLIVEAMLVSSATDPNESGNGTVCKENCDNSEYFGNDHTVVKKESANKLNATGAAKVEEDFFDELIDMLSPGKSNHDTENTIEPTTRGSRMLGDLQRSDAAEESNAKHTAFTARSPRRKIWMAALAGIVLKLASLLPLILGKLTIIGTTALLTSKLSLLIVTIIVLRGMFSSGKEHSYPEAAFTSPGHQGYQQDYSQGVTGYPAMGHASPNHRRWAYYRGVGRELGSWEDAQEENKE